MRADGTLIFPEPSFQEVYAQVSRRHGGKQSPEVIHRRFREAFARQERIDQENSWATSEEREHRRWRDIVAEVLDDLTDCQDAFATLYDHFASPDAWRVDPAQSGDAGAFGDIGTHAANLVEFITGEHIESICAELTMLPGRRIDDDGAALFRLSGGGKGTLTASQVLVGDINDLAIDIYCDEAGLHWRQEEPNTMRIGYRDKPTEVWHAGANRAYLAGDILAIQRTPGGHPEGYLEAFANIYRAFGEQLRGQTAPADEPGYATMADALKGMNFLRAALESSRQGAVWVDL